MNGGPGLAVSKEMATLVTVVFQIECQLARHCFLVMSAAAAPPPPSMLCQAKLRL